jgi:hsp70-interacting protein
MADKNLQTLLKWSIENQSGPPQNGTTNGTTETPNGTTPGRSTPALTPDVMAALFGGPSEADLMKAAMELITSPDPSITLDSRLTAFDNFEQLVESLDNANNMANMSLWEPLLSCLAHEESEIRRMAAWCVGTAVQNNVRSQEQLLSHGGIPTLVEMALKDAEEEAVRRKAVYALSSAVRNFQAGMDIFSEEMRKVGRDHGKVDAEDMDAIDAIMNALKEEVMTG